MKINSLNMFFAQRHKANLVVLVVFPIRMFHYCSLLPDFYKIWYWNSILNWNVMSYVINKLGVGFSETLVSTMYHSEGCYRF